MATSLLTSLESQSVQSVFPSCVHECITLPPHVVIHPFPSIVMSLLPLQCHVHTIHAHPLSPASCHIFRLPSLQSFGIPGPFFLSILSGALFKFWVAIPIVSIVRLVWSPCCNPTYRQHCPSCVVLPLFKFWAATAIVSIVSLLPVISHVSAPEQSTWAAP